MKLSALAEAVSGELHGDGNLEIQDATALYQASEGTITYLDDVAAFSQLVERHAAAVVLGYPDAKNRKRNFDVAAVPVPVILVEKPLAAFAVIVAMFHPPVERFVGVHPSAVLGQNVTLGKNVAIHANVCIMDNVTIGDDCTLFPNVTIYEGCQLGNRCILHAGAVIGAYGFGYDSSSGKHILSAQLGNVVLEDDVEIGANTTIDRGAFSSTRIGTGTKIDNQVMIGHNCQIGRHNLLCAHVGIAGSVTTGDYVVMAGQVGLADHIHIASHVILGAQAGVPGSINTPGTYLGSPVTSIDEMKKQFVAVKQLGTYWRTLKKLAIEKDAETQAGKES